MHLPGRLLCLLTLPSAMAISLAPAPTTARVATATVKASKWGVAYSKLCTDHFLPMAAVQSGVLRGGADAVGQLMHPGTGAEHVVAMALLGGVVSGYGNAVWLRALERVYGAGTGSATVLRKTATDFLCWAPLANSAYLYGLPLLTGKGAAAAGASLEGGFLQVMCLELCIFMPYNLVAFEHVPVSIRPLTSALLAALFTIGVGMLA